MIPERLWEGLRSVARVEEQDIEEYLRRTDRDDLTAEHLICIIYASHGLTNGEIAEYIGVPRTTVVSRMRQAMRRLNARSRAHLVATAFRQRLLD